MKTKMFHSLHLFVSLLSVAVHYHCMWWCIHWHCLWWCTHYICLMFIVHGMKYWPLLYFLCRMEVRFMGWLIGRYHWMLLLFLLNHCHLLHGDFHGLCHQHKRFTHNWHGISKQFIWVFYCLISPILYRPFSFAYVSEISSLWDCNSLFSRCRRLLSISPGTQFSSISFLLFLNLCVDEVLGVIESPSISAKILPLASFVTSRALFSTLKYVAGEFMLVDIELQELSKPNLNGLTEAEPENKLECHKALAQFFLTHFFYHLWQHLKSSVLSFYFFPFFCNLGLFNFLPTSSFFFYSFHLILIRISSYIWYISWAKRIAFIHSFIHSFIYLALEKLYVES